MCFCFFDNFTLLVIHMFFGFALLHRPRTDDCIIVLKSWTTNCSSSTRQHCAWTWECLVKLLFELKNAQGWKELKNLEGWILALSNMVFVYDSFINFVTLYLLIFVCISCFKLTKGLGWRPSMRSAMPLIEYVVFLSVETCEVFSFRPHNQFKHAN